MHAIFVASRLEPTLTGVTMKRLSVCAVTALFSRTRTSTIRRTQNMANQSLLSHAPSHLRLRLNLQSTRSSKPESQNSMVQPPLEAMLNKVLPLRSVVIPTTQSTSPTQAVSSNLRTISNRSLTHQLQALIMASTVSPSMADTR